MFVVRAVESAPAAGAFRCLQPVPQGPRSVTLPTPAEWASLTIEPVTRRTFRAEHVTEGKIAVDEDRSTPVFSPYAGRVTKLLARPGDRVVQGQPLFVIEAADTVQAQNDFVAAVTGLNKAKSQLELATDPGQARQGPVRRQGDPAEGLAAGPGRADFGAERPALRRDRARSRAQPPADSRPHRRSHHRVSGKRPDQPRSHHLCADRRHRGAAQDRPRPVCQRRRQRSGVRDRRSLDGLAHRLRARDRIAPRSSVGQEISFSVLALPGRTLTARINYVAAAIDPANPPAAGPRHHRQSRAASLKPEMFANVTIYSAGDHPAVGVPKQALIYEGDQVRVWVAHDDKTIELRQIKTGLSQRRPGRGEGQSQARRTDRHQGQPVH